MLMITSGEKRKQRGEANPRGKTRKERDSGAFPRTKGLLEYKVLIEKKKSAQTAKIRPAAHMREGKGKRAPGPGIIHRKGGGGPTQGIKTEVDSGVRPRPLRQVKKIKKKDGGKT